MPSTRSVPPADGRHAADHAHRRGLAGAVRAEEAERLAAAQLEVDAVDGGEGRRVSPRGIGFSEIVRFHEQFVVGIDDHVGILGSACDSEQAVYDRYARTYVRIDTQTTHRKNRDGPQTGGSRSGHVDYEPHAPARAGHRPVTAAPRRRPAGPRPRRRRRVHADRAAVDGPALRGLGRQGRRRRARRGDAREDVRARRGRARHDAAGHGRPRRAARAARRTFPTCRCCS